MVNDPYQIFFLEILSLEIARVPSTSMSFSWLADIIYHC
jgi:hypothetical protein